MRGRSRLMVVSAVAVAMFLVAGAAFAIGGNGPENDTNFSYAYDPADQVLIIAMSNWGFDWECTVADQSTLTAEYGFDENQQILISSLTDPSDGSADFSQCQLFGIQLTDKTNHGAFMVALHQLLDGMKGWGCINSVFAKSDLGKGSGDEGDDEATTTTTSTTTTTTTTIPETTTTIADFTFTSQGVTCVHGKSQDSHGKSGEPHGKSGDPHGNSQGYKNNDKGTDGND